MWKSSNPNTKEKLEELFNPNSISESDGYREFCLGGGAHTHYWDGVDERVTDEINRLIDQVTHDCDRFAPLTNQN